MLETLIVGGIISLLAVIISVWIALKVQQRHLLNIQAQQEAWERAQEGHQRIWEVRQGKFTSDIELKLTAQVQELRHEWRRWEAKDAQRAQAMEQLYNTTTAQLSVEYELARLPRVEETPLPANPNDSRQHVFANWQPPRLQGTNLSQRDLSYRYLGRADLREAKLTDSIFYMADLSGATLAGADLSGADLSGANLSGTDLRNTVLTNANLLVADLHNAVLIGANLRGARNLTPQQLYSAIYDSTTQFDIEMPSTERTKSKAQSLKPPMLLPPPADDSEIDLLATNLPTNRPYNGHADPVEGVRQRYSSKYQSDEDENHFTTDIT